MLRNLRVALVHADRDAHEGLVSTIVTHHGTAFPRAILGDLAAAAERCDIVIVFADGYDTHAVRARVDAIERWQDGPTLMVVSEQPSAWTFTLDRARPAVVVPSTEWMTKLAVLATLPTEPELPFTD